MIPSGILPITQSTGVSGAKQNLILIVKSEFADAFVLPGHGEPRIYCGEQRLRGCDKVEKHIEGFGGRPPGAIYLELYKRKCMRAVCPECYEAWAGREGDAATHRLAGYQKTIRSMRQPIHVILSPPVFDALDFSALRRECYTIAKQAGLNGGMLIFHPWRRSKGVVTDGLPSVTKAWKYSPHFHILGFGWVHNTPEIHDKTGWVIKNRGVRKSTRKTISYLLTHAGISENVHSVTWWGALSYNKVKIAKMPADRPTCPMCESVLIPLFDWSDSLGDPPPMDDVGRYWMKGNLWEKF